MIVAKAIEMAQRLLKEKLPSARSAIDATAGNGHDTLFLARSTIADAKIWAFDIQASALENTRKLLLDNRLADKVQLVHSCHTQVARYVPLPVDVAMFNLGYLPGGEHSVITKALTTVEALRQVTALLAAGGLISVVAYPGHADGLEENEAVRDFFQTLPQAEFAVGCWSIINQRNNPPLLYVVEKIKG